MVKAYKDNFLMSSNPFDECFAIHCNVTTADDDVAELAKVAGSKKTLDAPDASPAEAPPMEYDLEAELAQALNSDPDVAPAADAESAEPSMEFTGLIEDEFDKAMSEQAELLAEESEAEVAEQEIVVETAEPETPPVVSNAELAVAPVEQPAETVTASAEDNNSAFADQLAKLLSEQDTEPVAEVAAPSMVEADLGVPASETESAATLSPKLPVFEPETSAPESVEVAQPEEVLEIVDPPKDYSDPAAEFQTFVEKSFADVPAPAPVVPEPFRPAFDSKPIETVIGASAALGAAALASSSAHEEEQTTQLPPATTLESPDTQLASELDGAFREPFEADEDELVIPSADMLGPRVESGAGGRKVAFVVLAVALLGGVGAMASNYFGTSSTDAPVLMADGGAVKVKPKEAGGQVVPNQDQTVYKTVNGTSQKPAQKTLADNTEQPIEIAKVTPTKRETRVSDTQVLSDGTTGRLTPRSVRTSVVKPDGTIIATDSATSGVDLTRVEPGSTAISKKVKTVAITPGLSDTTNNMEAKVVESASVDPATSIMPKGVVEIRATDTQPANKITEPAKPVEVSKVETKAPKTVVKRLAPNKVKTVKKAKAAPKKTAPSASEANLPTVASPYAVQISSQRTPEAAQAAWSQLSRKYASVLRGQSPDIRRANIEGKGIYYRVRVPASSKAKAGSICAKLKKRGGSCFVTR